MGEWWDRADMECGMPYYINHRERKTQWDHPKYTEIINLLRECNVIKYAAYRTAAKLCVLQRTLHMEQVRMGLVVGVLDQHRLRAPENGVILEVPELEAVLADMFFASRRENMSDDDVDLNSELLLNFLLNAFDDKRKTGLTVLQVKVALIVLSCGRLQDKHQYLFHQVADHNNCISRRKLETLLRSLALIAEYLSEGQSFGPALVPATVDSCFQLSQGTLGVTEDGYMSWLLHEPQLLVWLSTFYRMRSAELVWHNVKCAVCKAQPIRGLRYRCLRCMGYEQCQTCFLTGKTNRKHKLSHPMQEYVGQTSSMEATRAFLMVLKNKVCRSSSKIQYLPVLPQDCISSTSSRHQRFDERGAAAGSCGDVTRLLDGLETTSRTVLYGSTLDLHPGKELQSIISQLELLCAADESANSNAPVATRRKVEAQVQRLKMLKRFLTLRVRPQVPHRTLERLESTPLVYAGQRNRKPNADHFNELSPIPMEKNSSYVPPREIQTDLPGPREFGEGAEASADDSSSLPSLTDRHPGDISSWLGDHQSFAISKPQNLPNLWLQNPRREPFNVRDEPSPSFDSRSEAQSDVQSEGQSEALSDVQRDRRLEELHKDLDTILDRLQNMLASNFAEDTVNKDNEKLQQDAIEIEDLLSGLIEGVESNHPPEATAVKIMTWCLKMTKSTIMPSKAANTPSTTIII